MLNGNKLALSFFTCMLAACSSESTSNTQSAGHVNANENTADVKTHSAVERVKSRIILYTHTDFNQSQVEAILLPVMEQNAVLYLRKIATQGHVLVIQAPDTETLQQKLDSINALRDVKFVEQDAILTIQEK
jgi:hypothetical protein